jgi:hypothetical protein
MPQLQFENLWQSLMRLPQVIKSVPDILRDPASNPLQAAILLGMALAIALILLLSVVLVFVRPSADEEALNGGEGVGGAKAAEPAQPFVWLTVISVIVLVFAAVWVTAGVSTADSSICISCHTTTVHSMSTISDPHKGVECVACHETGGPVAMATVNLGTRLQHIVLAQYRPSLAAGYGRPVASDACAGCHGNQIRGVATNKSRGLRISHKEPLAAGAQCVDCHALTSGVVNYATTGMAPCLRCHDGTTAKAQCSVCHVGEPAAAIRSSVATVSMAAAQVPNPQCNACHVDMRRCNACHGISMPHSVTFMAYGHARAGALDIWDNGGKTCRKCHYPGHNNCQRSGCHVGPFPSHASPSWKTDHASALWGGGISSCGCHNWNPRDHNGMTFCQICHAVKPPGARTSGTTYGATTSGSTTANANPVRTRGM